MISYFSTLFHPYLPISLFPSILKASFNHVISEMPYVLLVSVIYNMEPIKRKKPYSFSPIDCGVIKTVKKRFSKFLFPIINILIIRHGVKVMGFLTDLKVYNHHCSMS